jgi:hypothetical protein
MAYDCRAEKILAYPPTNPLRVDPPGIRSQTRRVHSSLDLEGYPPARLQECRSD